MIVSPSGFLFMELNIRVAILFRYFRERAQQRSCKIEVFFIFALLNKLSAL